MLQHLLVPAAMLNASHGAGGCSNRRPPGGPLGHFQVGCSCLAAAAAARGNAMQLPDVCAVNASPPQRQQWLDNASRHWRCRAPFVMETVSQPSSCDTQESTFPPVGSCWACGVCCPYTSFGIRVLGEHVPSLHVSRCPQWSAHSISRVSTSQGFLSLLAEVYKLHSRLCQQDALVTFGRSPLPWCMLLGDHVVAAAEHHD